MSLLVNCGVGGVWWMVKLSVMFGAGVRDARVFVELP